MCGIAGYYLKKDNCNDKNSDNFSLFLNKAKESLLHRGPDDSGLFISPTNSLGLAHTRLSIQDLSSAGRQPMSNKDGSVKIIFNGEIYNFHELKSELNSKGNYNWESDSDTEVILNLYLHTKNSGKSFTSFLSRLNGIFSLAIWDSLSEELLLARDHLGVKPLYYFLNDKGITFSSEIKAITHLLPLIAHKEHQSNKQSQCKLNHSSLERYLTFLWCPGNETAMSGVKKLRPGEYIRIKKGVVLEKLKWFKLESLFKPQFNISIKSINQDTENYLRQAVHRQMIADVPIGSFLSGGLDSSTIVYFAREINPNIQCFTIETLGSLEKGFEDDLPYAKKVASYLNVPLEVVKVNADNLVKDIEEMIWQLDEPLADIAPLNVYYISRFAKDKGTKVLLSGVGGDDLFTGYRRHQAQEKEVYWEWLPQERRNMMKNISNKLNTTNPISRRIRKAFSGANLNGDNRLINYFRWIDRADLKNLYSKSFKESINNSVAEAPMLEMLSALPRETSKIDKMLSLEQKFFLPDHNLNYTDKMSMKASVEVRVPFLDIDLVKFANSIPSSIKQKGSQSKWILKKTMEHYLPREIIYRPKMGFGGPLRGWLKNELKEWLVETLSNERIKQRGIFDPSSVQQMIIQNQNGEKDASYTLFSLICIEIWCQKFLDINV